MGYVNRNKIYNDVNIPVDTEEDFAQTLQEVWLKDANGVNPAKLDISFSADGKRVEAARFLIQVRPAGDRTFFGPFHYWQFIERLAATGFCINRVNVIFAAG